VGPEPGPGVSRPENRLFQLEWRENGRRLSRSLKHRDWPLAKRQADEFAAGLAGPDLNGKAEAEPEPLTLGILIAHWYKLDRR